MALLIQMVGRGLRLHEGKEDCLIVDFGQCFDWLGRQWLGGKKTTDPIDLDYAPLCPRKRTPVEVLTKECPECSAEIPIFAAICPACGHEFPEGEAKAKPSGGVEFILTEFQTPEQKQAWKWLRKTLFNWFDKGKDLSPIFEKFKQKFGYLPPHDWFIGALFSFQDSSINAAIYTDKLRRANPRISDAVVSFMLRLEFGEPGRKYVLPDGEYCPKAHTVQAFNWWEYLGVKRFCTPDEIKLAYQEKVMSDPCPEALNYALKTGLFVRGGK
jgi:hypothetical protein